MKRRKDFGMLKALVVAAGLGFVATVALGQVTPGSVTTRQTLAQSRVPMILPSSGSMANNGALTLTTAVDQTYPDAYFYMPAGAIAVGSVAGFYYGQMSSASAATLYNNLYVSGTPTIPASPVAFVTTGPGAYTQTTGSVITAHNISIPGGFLGPNDEVQSHGVIDYNNSAGVKTIALGYGAFTYGIVNPSTTSAQSFQAGFANVGKQSRQGQTGTTAMGLGTIAGTYVNGTIDATSNQNLVAALKLATATDYVILQSYTAERIIPANN